MSIEISNLVKKFDNSDAVIFDGINLTVSDGEFVCILGPSGCGKSTLLNIIAGLIKPSGGTITADGREVTAPGADRVMMFQESALFPWLTVWDNVLFGMRQNKVSKDEMNERAEKYLAMVHLSEYKNYRVHQISGGMKQRCALARALSLNSGILLMDEPFASLDKQTINVLRDELVEIWQRERRTIIYVTHSVEEAIFFSDRVVMLSSSPGRIKKIYDIGFPRPRHIDSAEFLHIRADILKQLRNEVDITEKFDIQKA